MKRAVTEVRHEAMRIAGDRVRTERVIEVRYPYTGELVATVPRASVDDVRRDAHEARLQERRAGEHQRTARDEARKAQDHAPDMDVLHQEVVLHFDRS